MLNKYLLGCDIGTSGTKSVIFTSSGEVVSSHTSEYPLYQPHNGWAEQDPTDWKSAVFLSIKQAIAKSGINSSDIVGVGLSGQMHGLVMLDKEGIPLRRAIIWCDQRTSAECDDITSLVGAKRLVEITGNPAITGFTASKIMWVKKHEPEIYEKCAKILLPKDYIRYELTGEFAAEYSDASGMQLLDVPARKWSSEVCSKLGIDMSLLAPLCESSDISGRITEKAAELTGLCPGTPVAGGAGDQAAAAVGNGIVKSGIISSTIGSSGVVFAHTDKVTIDPLGRVHTFCHAVPNSWHIMGVTQGAGISLKWFRDNFCKAEIQAASDMDIDSYELLNREAAKSPVGANGLIFLPYFMGERTPHLDPDARGVFFGLSASHSRRDMLRAVMEGVAYSLSDCMDIIKSLGCGASEVRASGGGGRSVLWREMQADMFGCPVVTTNSSEAGALGVALLAAVACGIYSSVPEACDSTIKAGNPIYPNLSNSAVYEPRHRLYSDIYTSLKKDFKMLSTLQNK